MKLNRNAQVSLEILAILGVVVLGAVVAGVYYINNLNEQVGQGDELGNLVDDFGNAFEDVDTPGYNNGGSTTDPDNPDSEACNNNGVCEEGENVLNCISDCGAYYGIENIYVEDEYSLQSYDVDFDANTNFTENYIEEITLYKKSEFGGYTLVSNSYYNLDKGTYDSINKKYDLTKNDAPFDTKAGDFYRSTLEFEFLQEGEYKIAVIAKNDLDVGPADFGTETQSSSFEVIATNPFAVEITSPLNDQVYEENEILNLSSNVSGTYTGEVQCMYLAKYNSDITGNLNLNLMGVESNSNTITKKEDTFYFGDGDSEPIDVGDWDIYNTYNTNGWFKIADLSCTSTSFIPINGIFEDNYGSYTIKVVATDEKNVGVEDNVNIFYKDPTNDWIVSFNPPLGQLIGSPALLDIFYAGNGDSSSFRANISMPEDLEVGKLDYSLGDDLKYILDNYDVADLEKSPTNFYGLNSEDHLYFYLNSSRSGNYDVEIELRKFMATIGKISNEYNYYTTDLDVNLVVVDVDYDSGNSVPNFRSTNYKKINSNNFYFGAVDLGSEVESTSPYEISENSKLVFVSSVTGGSNDYNFSWNVDNNLLSDNEIYTYYFDTPGVYTVSLEVIDNVTKEIINLSRDINVVANPFNIYLTSPVSGATYFFNDNLYLNSSIVGIDGTEGSDYECSWYLKNNNNSSSDFSSNENYSESNYYLEAGDEWTEISSSCSGDFYDFTTSGVGIKEILLEVTKYVGGTESSDVNLYRQGSFSLINTTVTSFDVPDYSGYTNTGVRLFAFIEDLFEEEAYSPETNCSWTINGQPYTDSDDCAISLTPEDLETLGVDNSVNGQYYFTVTYTDTSAGDSVDFTRNRSLSIAECYSSDVACPYGGVCHPDPNFNNDVGVCKWVLPQTDEGDLLQGNEYVTYIDDASVGATFNDVKVPHGSSFGNTGFYSEVTNKFYTTSYRRETSTLKSYPILINRDGATNNITSMSVSDDYGSSHKGIPSMSEFIDSPNGALGNEGYVFGTYLEASSTSDPYSSNIFNSSTSDQNIFGFLLPVGGDSEGLNSTDPICNSCGEFMDDVSYDWDNCRVMSVGSNVINLDSGDTNIIVPVYYVCEEGENTVAYFSKSILGNEEMFGFWYSGLNSDDEFIFNAPEVLVDPNYTYDFPSSVARGEVFGIAGVRYSDNPEFYIYYTLDGGKGWNFESAVLDYFDLPLISRGNTLSIDSKGIFHYAYGSSPFFTDVVDNVKYLVAVNTYGSKSKEILFNPHYDVEGYDGPITPLNGFNPDYKFGSKFVSSIPGIGGAAIHRDKRTLYYESLVPNMGEMEDNFVGYDSSYQQQAHNVDKDWVVQLWQSWDISDNGGSYINSYDRYLKIAISADGGLHWTPPVTILSDVYSALSGSRIADDFSRPVLIKDIADLGNDVGEIVITYYEGGYAGNTISGDLRNLILEIDFSTLTKGLIEDVDVRKDYMSDIDPKAFITLPVDFSVLDDLVAYNPDLLSENGWTDFIDEQPIDQDDVDLDKVVRWEGQLSKTLPGSSISNKKDFYYPISSSQSHDYTDVSTNPWSCFKAGTLVSTPEGLRQIEDISKGDVVYSFDEDAKELVATNVKKLLKHNLSLSELVNLTLSNGVKIDVTLNHAFYDPVNKKYASLQDFNIGDFVYFYDSNIGSFTKIQIESIEVLESVDFTYNLSLGVPNNYLANGVLVHNASKFGSVIQDYFEDLDVSFENGTNYFGAFYRSERTTVIGHSDCSLGLSINISNTVEPFP